MWKLRPILSIIFSIPMILGFLIFAAPGTATASPESFFMAEGLLSNGRTSEAWDYYQAALVSLDPLKEKDLRLKTLERLISLCDSLGKSTLAAAYEKTIAREWPELAGTTLQRPAGPKVKPLSGGSAGASVKPAASARPAATSKPKKPGSGIKARIRIYYGAYRPYEKTTELDLDQKDEFRSDPDRFVSALVEKQKQNFAAERGYSVDSFGSDNYRMVKITSVVYKIYDAAWGKTIMSNEDEAGSLHR